MVLRHPLSDPRNNLLSVGTCQIGVAAETENRPNIVLILADDLGYGDLGCYGHPVAKTPHLDQLAKQGVKFTQHYANGPECSPTRTAFLTGKYQQRAGGLECAIGTGNVGRYDDAIRLANQKELGLPASQSILPRAMKQAGYTCGIFGKWHLGYEPQFNPMVHGWDEFFGYLGGNVDYFTHRETSDLHVLFRGKLPVYREGYMTHLITDDSIAFIETAQTAAVFPLCRPRVPALSLSRSERSRQSHQRNQLERARCQDLCGHARRSRQRSRPLVGRDRSSRALQRIPSSFLRPITAASRRAAHQGRTSGLEKQHV